MHSFKAAVSYLYTYSNFLMNLESYVVCYKKRKAPSLSQSQSKVRELNCMFYLEAQLLSDRQSSRRRTTTIKIMHQWFAFMPLIGCYSGSLKCCGNGVARCKKQDTLSINGKMRGCRAWTLLHSRFFPTDASTMPQWRSPMLLVGCYSKSVKCCGTGLTCGEKEKAPSPIRKVRGRQCDCLILH